MVVRPGGAEDPAERIERLLTGQEAVFRRVFLQAIENIVDAHTLSEVEELLLQGRVDEALSELDAAAALLGNQYGQSFTAAANDTARFLSQSALTVTIAFDQTNQRAVDIIARSQLRLIRQFTEEQRIVTRQALQDGIARGLNPRDQARNFRGSIGLTQTQQRAVENFRRLLTDGRAGNLPSQTALNRALRDGRFDRTILRSIRDNRPLSEDQVDRMVERYRQRYIRYRSEVIARTEALRAVHEGSQQAYAQAIDMGQINPAQLQRRWVTASDERVRTSHARLNGQIRGFGEAWQADDGELRYPGDPDAPASETVQCFTGDVMVSADGVQRAFRRWYEGDLIDIEISDGNTLSVTPNHPILTRHGWVAAGEIVKGCDVVCGTGIKRVVSGNVDVKDVPARFDEVFDALANSGNNMRERGCAMDFHGDGGSSDIDVVLPASDLPRGSNPSGGKHGDQLALTFPNPMSESFLLLKPGPFEELISRLTSASASVVRRLYLSAPLGFSHSGPFERLCLPQGSHVRASIAKNRPHGGSGYTIMLGERIFRFAALVKLRCLGFINEPSRTSNVDLFKTEFSQAPVDSGRRDIELCRNILNGQFGAVHFSKVTRVSKRQAATHVYNLQTKDGFYIANGVVAHNCRCVVSTRVLSN